METNKDFKTDVNVNEEELSYKGALFSSIVFVGGTIIACIVLLIVLFMIRM